MANNNNNKTGGDVQAPVIAGLAVGIAFVMLITMVLFLPSPISWNNQRKDGDDQQQNNNNFTLSIQGLKDHYSARENIDFVVIAKGYGSMCGVPNAEIINSKSGRIVYNLYSNKAFSCFSPPAHTIMTNQPWTLKDMDAPPAAGYYLKVKEGRSYKVIVEYHHQMAEKSFDVSAG